MNSLATASIENSQEGCGFLHVRHIPELSLRILLETLGLRDFFRQGKEGKKAMKVSLILCSCNLVQQMKQHLYWDTRKTVYTSKLKKIHEADGKILVLV